MGKLSQQFQGDCAVYYFQGEQNSIKESRRVIFVALIDRYGVRIVRRHLHQLVQALDNIERKFWYG